VKSLVDLHRGDLQVESVPGKGSEFSFELSYPVSKESPDEMDSQSEQKSIVGFTSWHQGAFS